MGNHRYLRTSCASPQETHAPETSRQLQGPAVEESSRLKIKELVRLCCALVLLAVVVIGKSSFQNVHHDESSTVAALRSSAWFRESIHLTKRETTVNNEDSGGMDFDFARYDLFLNGSQTSPPTEVLIKAVELMHSLTQVPTNTSFVHIVGQLLLESFGVDRKHRIRNEIFDSQMTQDARKVILGLPFPAGTDLILYGHYLQIATLQANDTLRDPVVALCSLRDKASLFENIRLPNDQGTTQARDDCYFTLAMSSAGLQNSRIAIIAYPKNWIIRPLPSIGYQILNSRIVDIAIKPSTRRERFEDHLLTIFFNPTLKFNTTKGCSFWSKSQKNWTAEGCWVDLSKSPDVCHCNMSTHLEEDATGGQYIVYEYSEVLFNELSFNQMEEFRVYRDEPNEYFFSEASALMHNLSLTPVIKVTTKYLLTQIMAFTLDAIYGSQDSLKTKFTVDNIKRVYVDARKIVRSPVEGESLSISHKNLDMVTIALASQDPRGFKNSFYFNHFLKARFAPSTQAMLQVIQVTVFSIALAASYSVGEQNELVAYMIFPVNRFFFTPIEKLGHFQVHNYRIVDVTLVPRAGSHGEEAQFMDIWYRPSVFNAFSKDMRLGCAYWSNQDSAWTSEGCAVHVNTTLKGCRFNLSAHFDDNREGGQYAVYEYSNVILGTERIKKILDNNESVANNQQDYNLSELGTYLHNMTQIGFIDEEGLLFTHRIANYAFTTAEEYVRSDANVSSVLVEAMHKIAQRWACDNNRKSSLRGRYDYRVENPSLPVALEAHEVLSNKAVQTKSFLNLMSFFSLRMSQYPESGNGFTILPRQFSLWNETEIHTHDKPELSVYFSVNPMDKDVYAVIIYPTNKMLLPLSDTLPPIFSYHGIEVAIVEEVDTGAFTSKLVTLIHVPDGSTRAAASTECAVWTGDNWSVNTCWPVIGNEYACRCNLSAHLLSVGTFQHFLIYEAIKAPNFSPIAALGALNILYVVSSTASLIGLTLIVLTAAVFPVWRSDVGHKIMVHLSLALFLYQTLRLIRETHHVYTALNRDLTTAFIAFTAITHYSRLAHYAWMLTMSVLQLRRLLTVVGASDIPHLLIKVSVLAWGVPLVPLVVLLSWDINAHFARPDMLTHLTLYLVPGAAIIIINSIFLVTIGARVFACFGWGVVDDLGRHGISNAKLTGRRMAMLLLLFFLFGTPTVFEMANDFWGHSVALEVLFKLFDPVRGVVVFVFFVILDKTTLDLWRQKLRSLTEKIAIRGFEMK